MGETSSKYVHASRCVIPTDGSSPLVPVDESLSADFFGAATLAGGLAVTGFAGGTATLAGDGLGGTFNFCTGPFCFERVGGVMS